jgi:hypothetical protein
MTSLGSKPAAIFIWKKKQIFHLWYKCHDLEESGFATFGLSIMMP